MNRNLIAFASVFFLFFTVLPAYTEATECCGIDVYNLHVYNDKISVYIQGDCGEEQDVTYTIFVNGDEIATGDVFIEAGDSYYLTYAYFFGTGTNVVKVTAETDCAMDDETSVYTRIDDWECDDCDDYCIEGAVRCDYDDERIVEVNYL